jgi:alpha-ribazole phosphatase
MKVLLIRHGKTLENEAGLYVGSTDTSLSAQGMVELNAIKNIYEPWVSKELILVSSPMKRCKETAEILFENHSIDEIVEDLRETDFGIFEGKHYEELKEDSRYRHWVDTYEIEAPPGGEAYTDFVDRVLASYKSLVRKYGTIEGELASTKTLAIVCHGGVIRLIMSRLINPNIDFFQWETPNGLGYIIDTATDEYQKL